MSFWLVRRRRLRLHLDRNRSASHGNSSYAGAQGWMWPVRICAISLLIGPISMISACNVGQPIGEPDWRDETLYAKVDEVTYELQPGLTYGLGSLSDEAIDSAIADGQGTLATPLDVSNLRIGVPSADGSRLEYDVSIVGSTEHLAAREAVDLPTALSDLMSIGFDIDMNDLSNETIENHIILKFQDGSSIDIPVTCRAQQIEAARPVSTCSNLLLNYKGNFVSINSRSGDFDAVLRHFQNGLTLISKIESD